jgi:hypothetical protein
MGGMANDVIENQSSDSLIVSGPVVVTYSVNSFWVFENVNVPW